MFQKCSGKTRSVREAFVCVGVGGCVCVRACVHGTTDKQFYVLKTHFIKFFVY